MPRAQRDVAKAHLASCSSCDENRQQLAELISVMRADTSTDAPRDIIAQAVGIFRQREIQPSLLRRIVAALTFDSFAREPAFGVRSGQEASRQLLFEAEGHDLDLRLVPQGDEWIVAGQVFGTSCVGGQVELFGEAGTAAADLNDLCEFKLAPVPTGNYRLRLRLEGVEVEIPQLALGT